MSGLYVAAAMTVANLLSGISAEGEIPPAAKAFVDEQVAGMQVITRENETAPPLWFDCIAEVHETGALYRELKRMAGNDAGAFEQSAEDLVKNAVTRLCEDALFEN